MREAHALQRERMSPYPHLRRSGYGGLPLVSVVIFCSAARGNSRKDRDLSVLIVARGLPEGKKDRSKPFDDLEKRLSDELAYFSRVPRGERTFPARRLGERATGCRVSFIA